MKPQLLLATDQAEQVLKNAGLMDFEHGGLTRVRNHTKFNVEFTKLTEVVKALMDANVRVSIVAG